MAEQQIIRFFGAQRAAEALKLQGPHREDGRMTCKRCRMTTPQHGALFRTARFAASHATGSPSWHNPWRGNNTVVVLEHCTKESTQAIVSAAYCESITFYNDLIFTASFFLVGVRWGWQVFATGTLWYFQLSAKLYAIIIKHLNWQFGPNEAGNNNTVLQVHQNFDYAFSPFLTLTEMPGRELKRNASNRKHKSSQISSCIVSDTCTYTFIGTSSN